MDRTERFYKIHQLLQIRRATPMGLLEEELGVSRATVKRDIEYLRDRFAAPIVWDGSLRGYRYEAPADGSSRFSLPGLWFSAGEIHALLTMQHLLGGLQPGFLEAQIKPLRSRIRALLDSGDHSISEVENRIRILHMAARPVESAHFQLITTALLQRKRLCIEHYNRGTDTTLSREVSPQRLAYYRDNWYLDAWCHLRRGLRSFSVDAISAAAMLDAGARNVAVKTLESVLGSGYGIFGGCRTHRAVLRFTPQRARWVAREKWHSAQTGDFDDAGYYLLTVPYTNDTELLMDILKYGPDVEVLRPAALRRKVADALSTALSNY